MRLLVVDDAFEVPGQGLVVRPEVEALDASVKKLTVELRRPDGSVITAEATVKSPHLAPRDRSQPARRLLALHGVSASDVPAGTEIFAEG